IGGYVEAPIGANSKYGSISLAGRHSIIDAILPGLLQATTPPGRSAFIASPQYWDYQLRYRLSLGKHRFEVSAFGSNDLLTLAAIGDDQTQAFSLNTEQGFHRFRVRWQYLDDGLTLSFAPTVGFTTNSLNLSDTIKFA